MSTKLNLATKIAAQTGIEQQVVQLALDGIVDVPANSGRLELRGASGDRDYLQPSPALTREPLPEGGVRPDKGGRREE